MESREKWFSVAAQCIGGATVICVILLAGLGLAANELQAQELALFWLMPVPCLALLPLMALIGRGILRCGYLQALKQTAKGYGRGALLGIAIVAMAAALYYLTECVCG